MAACPPLSVSVSLETRNGTRTTDTLLFSYLPPTVDMVLPSTMDADGTAVTVRGSNFGREQDVRKWTDEEAAVAVSIGARRCSHFVHPRVPVHVCACYRFVCVHLLLCEL
jgi:hypothetical protein